ncbi:unnamed protein product, partial [Iphiclides podalirius]
MNLERRCVIAEPHNTSLVGTTNSRGYISVQPASGATRIERPSYLFEACLMLGACSTGGVSFNASPGAWHAPQTKIRRVRQQEAAASNAPRKDNGHWEIVYVGRQMSVWRCAAVERSRYLTGWWPLL